MLQIGVMGSAADLKFSKEAEEFAKELGRIIGEKENILVYGAENGYTSLPTIAAESASNSGGITVGVCGGSKDIYGSFRPTVLIDSGLLFGGGREFALVRSCDGIIAIGGGSGTLTEMAIAYQKGIPIVCIDKFDGWSKELADTYMDDRKRVKCERASTPDEAVDKIIELINESKLKDDGIKVILV